MHINYEFINNLLLVGNYTVYITWLILMTVLSVALYRRNWTLVKRTVKYLLNTMVFMISWMFIIELALVVRPAFYETKEASIVALRRWIEIFQIKDIYIATATILVLFVINFFFHFKVEKKENKKDLFILTIFDTVTLFAAIWLTGQSAYYGLMQEINRHFS